jgi:hypothetical protein
MGGRDRTASQAQRTSSAFATLGPKRAISEWTASRPLASPSIAEPRVSLLPDQRERSAIVSIAGCKRRKTDAAESDQAGRSGLDDAKNKMGVATGNAQHGMTLSGTDARAMPKFWPSAPMSSGNSLIQINPTAWNGTG